MASHPPASHPGTIGEALEAIGRVVEGYGAWGLEGTSDTGRVNPLGTVNEYAQYAAMRAQIARVREALAVVEAWSAEDKPLSRFIAASKEAAQARASKQRLSSLVSGCKVELRAGMSPTSGATMPPNAAESVTAAVMGVTARRGLPCVTLSETEGVPIRTHVIEGNSYVVEVVVNVAAGKVEELVIAHPQNGDTHDAELAAALGGPGGATALDACLDGLEAIYAASVPKEQKSLLYSAVAALSDDVATIEAAELEHERAARADAPNAALEAIFDVCARGSGLVSVCKAWRGPRVAFFAHPRVRELLRKTKHAQALDEGAVRTVLGKLGVVADVSVEDGRIFPLLSAPLFIRHGAPAILGIGSHGTARAVTASERASIEAAGDAIPATGTGMEETELSAMTGGGSISLSSVMESGMSIAQLADPKTSLVGVLDGSTTLADALDPVNAVDAVSPPAADAPRMGTDVEMTDANGTEREIPASHGVSVIPLHFGPLRGVHEVAANFVLRLREDLPAAALLTHRLDAVVWGETPAPLVPPGDPGAPFVSIEDLLLRGFGDERRSAEASRVPDAVDSFGAVQRSFRVLGRLQRYNIVTRNGVRGYLIRRIPFTHPRHIFPLLQLLRQQLVFNWLFLSACGNDRQRVDANPTEALDDVVEVSAVAPSSIAVTLPDPSGPGLACIHITIEQGGVLTASLRRPRPFKRARTDAFHVKDEKESMDSSSDPAVDSALTDTLQRTFSIPLAICELLGVRDGPVAASSNDGAMAAPTLSLESVAEIVPHAVAASESANDTAGDAPSEQPLVQSQPQLGGRRRGRAAAADASKAQAKTEVVSPPPPADADGEAPRRRSAREPKRKRDD